MEQIKSRLQAREINGSIECHDYTDDVSNMFLFLFYKTIKIPRLSFGIILYLKKKSLNTLFNGANDCNF